jgi:hypothetical protein
MWFAYIHCWATDVFSVLWSDPRLYSEKTRIIDSQSKTRSSVQSCSVAVQLSVESQPVKSAVVTMRLS